MIGVFNFSGRNNYKKILHGHYLKKQTNFGTQNTFYDIFVLKKKRIFKNLIKHFLQFLTI